METIQFLRAVLGPEGFYCVVGLKKDSEKRVQKFFPDIESAHAVAQQLHENKFDAYFALATYTDGKSRKVANAKLLKSFWLDIDCGAGKTYLTQVEGITALKKFCKDAGLPRPLLVNSGRGIHAYWPLDKAVEAAEWLPVAQALKDLCVTHEFAADPAVTSDVARILRVPGTSNFKDEPPLPVEVISAELTEIPFGSFRDAVGTTIFKLKPFIPMEMDEATKSLLGSFVSKFKTILNKTAKGIGCRQLANIVENQASVEEPLWRAGLSIANYCVDRDKAIHFISKKHPDYDADYTETKANQTKGPYTCETFEKLNPGGCAGCPHLKLIRSPITLGREVEEASEEDNIVQAVPATHPEAPAQTYVIPKSPPPYMRGKNGGVFRRTRGEEADVDVPVYHHDIYVVRRIVDPEMGESVLVRLHLPKDGVREFTVPLTSVLSKDEFRKHFGGKGVALAKMDELMYYIIAWINNLQMETTADVARRQFGWTDDKFTSFIIGDKEVKADCINMNPPSSSTVRMFPYFQEKGTLDGWKDMVKFFERPKMELFQFAIGLGFGSPLMALTGVNAAMVHLYNPESGYGKTTVMQMAASIWGNPEEMMTKESDTMNARFNRAEVYKNILLPLDELTNATAKELSNMLYQYTSGHQKDRMGPSSNVARFRGDTWQQLCISTGNAGILEVISGVKAMPKGEAMRVLEFFVGPANLPDKSVTDELSLALRKNYGTACIPYLQHIMKDVEGTDTLFRATQAKLDKAIGLKAPDRFYSALAACGITGLIIAKRLGVISFEIAPIVAWLIDAMTTTKENVASMTIEPEAVLNNFLAENYNNILRIKSTDDGRHPTNDTDMLIIPDGTPRVSLIARYEYDVKKLYILPKTFKKWCIDQQINYTSLVSALKSGRTRAVLEKKRMSRGTRMNLPAAYALCIDCSEFLNDETEFAIAKATAGTSKESIAQPA